MPPSCKPLSVGDYVALPYFNDMQGRRRVVELFRNALVAATN